MPSLKNPKADLKRIYHRAMELSVTIVLALMIVAFKFAPQESISESIVYAPPTLITVEDIFNTVQKPDIPPPPKAPEIIAATIDDVPENIILPDIDDVKPVKIPDKPPSKPKIIENDIIFEVVEEMPSPIGGLKAIQEKVHYTEIARRIGLEGTIYITATINKNGDVEDAIILKGLGGGLNEEALNAVLATKFAPGKQRGKPVNVKMVIPIKFVLK